MLEIDDETILGTANPDDRNQAYAELRDVLLEHTDVLVAVSDDIDGGQGGTVDVIRIAVREGIPVVKISTGKPQVYLMQAATLDEPDQTPREDEEFHAGRDFAGQARDNLDRILAPPRVPPDAGHRSHEEGRPARERLGQFLCKVFAPADFRRMFKASRDAMTVQPKHGDNLLADGVRQIPRVLEQLPDRPAGQAGACDVDGRVRGAGAEARQPVRAILADSHGWADALAVRYADATRSSYIAIAFLGAMAVLVYSALSRRATLAAEIKIGALLPEGVILAIAAYRFFTPAHDGRWHQRVIEYRAIAELLRHARFVYMLGAADRLERTADRSWREPDAWVGWYVRAILRELGFPRPGERRLSPHGARCFRRPNSTATMRRLPTTSRSPTGLS